MSSYAFGTSYCDFYSSMINVPFLGSSFNTIMPLLIIIIGGIFALISLRKIKSKTLTAVKNFSKKHIVEDGAADTNTGKKERPSSDLVEQNIVQSILKGERAILLEIDFHKKKEERAKLLRFNNNSAVDALRAQKQQDIEMASTKGVRKEDDSLPAPRTKD